MAVGKRPAAGMEALHAAVKAELGEDGLPTCGGAEVPAVEHGHGWSVSVMKAEVKSEVSCVDLYRETLMNVEIKSETSRPSRARTAVAWPPGTAAHGLAEGMADEGGSLTRRMANGWRRMEMEVPHAQKKSSPGIITPRPTQLKADDGLSRRARRWGGPPRCPARPRSVRRDGGRADGGAGARSLALLLAGTPLAAGVPLGEGAAEAMRARCAAGVVRCAAVTACRPATALPCYP